MLLLCTSVVNCWWLCQINPSDIKFFILTVCVKLIFHSKLAAKVVPLFSKTEPERNVLFHQCWNILAELYTCAGKAHRRKTGLTKTPMESHWCLALQGPFCCWQMPEEPRSMPAQSISPQLCVQVRGYQMLLPALLLDQVAEVPSLELWTPPWNMSLEPCTAQFVSWGAWIPAFWSQKMTSGCVLRVPGLQTQGSLAAASCDALIQPLITWSSSVFPPQNSCVFQGLGWLVLF